MLNEIRTFFDHGHCRYTFSVDGQGPYLRLASGVAGEA